MARKPENLPHLFRTTIPVPENPRKIEHTHTILSIGSCFSEHIALRLKDFLFRTCINPTGILYNPASISQAIRAILSGKSYSRKDLFLHEGLWKSFDHHSDFNGKTPQKSLEKINSAMKEAIICIEKLDVLIITFGTAFVYRKKDTARLVANCHRLPNNAFQRSLLSIHEIVTDYTGLFSELYKRLPGITIIVTVSPVRHLRDNPHENQVSKSHLISAVYELESIFSALYYFPSYEILMDELRDYRFYSDDMAHPAPIAFDYIREKFLSACVSKKSRDFISDYIPVYQAKEHHIKDSSSERTVRFAQKQIKYIDTLETRYPEISLTGDKEYFSSLL